MSQRQPVRTMIVAVSGGVLLALGSGVPGAVAANAAPAQPVTGSDYPLGGSPRFPMGNGAQGEQGQRNRQAEKAEHLGGSAFDQAIDFGVGLVKCGANIVTDAVDCPL